MAAASHQAQSELDALEDDEAQRRHRLLLHKAQAARRGETISLVFAMQGIGAVVGSAFLLCLIFFSGQTRTVCDAAGLNSAGYEPNALNIVWRAFYFIGGIFVFLVVLYRTLIEEESIAWATLEERKERRKILGRKELSLRQIFQFYGSRLVGTGGNWLVINVTFYGLKLFSGPIFEVLDPGGDLVVKNGYLLLYNVIGLAGYYVAAAVMDNPKVGRKRLQMGSFAVLTVLFCLAAALFPVASPGVLMTLFFLSNFFSTLGANATTYVMAAETFPTELRGTCHGASAFLGKLGALLATIVFGVVDLTAIFWICAAVSLVGVALTYVFSCDLTGLSFDEHDAQLELLLEDRIADYKGRLNAPEHLSNYELWTGRHGQYDPDWARRHKRRHPQDAVQEAAAIAGGGNASVASLESRPHYAGSIQELPDEFDDNDDSNKR